MKLPGLKFAFCISLLVHGAVFSIVSRFHIGPGSVTHISEQGITLEIVSEPETVSPVVSPVPDVAVEPRIVTESVPLQPALPPSPAEFPKATLESAAATSPAPVENLNSVEEPRSANQMRVRLSFLKRPEVARPAIC